MQEGLRSWYDDWPHLTEEVTEARSGYVSRPKPGLLREGIKIQIHLALGPEARLSTTSPGQLLLPFSITYLLAPLQDSDWFWPQATAGGRD